MTSESAATSICVGCGLCCDGSLFRSATLREGDDRAALEAAGLRIRRRSDQQMALVLGCAGFADGCCTVYEIRPVACRQYRCQVLRLVESGDLPEADARDLVADTLELRRQVATLGRHLDPPERLMLETVYRALLRKFEPTSPLAGPLVPPGGAGAGPATDEVTDRLGMDEARRGALAAEAIGLPEGFVDQALGAPEHYLAIAENLADDLGRAEGSHHPGVMAARHLAATLVGLSGQPLRALELHRALATDRAERLGADHPDTLSSRHEVADWEGICGEPEAAIAGHAALVADRELLLGPTHAATLDTRAAMAYWLGVSGRADDARAAYRTVAVDVARMEGPDNPRALAARQSAAHWAGVAGDLEAAVAEMSAVMVDRLRVDGSGAVETEFTGRAVAYWSRRAAETADADGRSPSSD